MKDKTTVENFNNDYSLWLFNNNKQYIRGLLIGCILFFATFTLVDFHTITHSFKLLTTIRFVVGIPALIIALGASYIPKLNGYMRIILPTSLFILNFSVIIMYYYSTSLDTAFTNYSFAYILTIASLMLSMSGMALPIFYIIVSVITFNCVSIFKHELAVTNLQLFTQSIAYISSAGFFSILGTRIICKFSKQLFISQHNISLERDTVIDQKETLKEMNDTKDMFFNIIAHDLRSPFNTLIGYFLILLQDDSTNISVPRDEIKRIFLHVRRTYNLLSNLLIWSKSHLKKSPFSPQSYLVKDVVSDNISLFNEIAQQKNIQLKYNILADESIFCDKDMTTTIIRNLIFNAIKFTRPNGLITINTTQSSDHKYLKIAVIDNGVGIDAESKQNILSSQQYSTPGTSNEEGSGIGLLICQEFLQKHHSKLFIDSKPKEGSNFYFSLSTTKAYFNNTTID